MQADVTQDLMYISLRKSVSITLGSSSPRRWTGKFAGFEDGEIGHAEGGEGIRYGMKGNISSLRAWIFFLGTKSCASSGPRSFSAVMCW
jgi:hypothetical protein